MFSALIKKIIGSKNDREIKRLQEYVVRINSLEPEIVKLSDAQLKGKTAEFKERLEKGEDLESLLPESFAVVRETAKRVLNMRHFDVQLMGGVVLHEGKIAEMKTGEGKTLVATLAAYLNALTGRGVHIVTVNDYLARRDTQWMGGIFTFLGLSVGVIQHDLDDTQRKLAYQADITYGTNNEFGFDYLRDNMKYSLDDCVQGELHYAIVDEVDSILIDEARTPLIISGPAEESTDKYYKIDRIIPRLKRELHYQIEEKTRTVSLTEEGVARAENDLGISNLYDPANIEILHHVNQGLKAHALFKKDVDYVVKDGQVIIVDEFTGRLMPGRRYSEGLHQALEAKEKVKVANENQTLATITFQNYFRMYAKLAGMTGTADTEAAEFAQIYNLDVVVIPTNQTLIRYNYSDLIYRTEREKFEAAVGEIEELNKIGRPVLVGTISIEKSERLSGMLKRKGIPHHVLNAKHHEQEAEIVAQAGQEKAVTIATNMAGRGTDIILGPGIAHKGGLHILGTERHESRRIDNQLRGRAGRQGDPGSSRFYLSLEDDLLRIFGSDRISGIMGKLGMEEGQPIEHKMVTKAIENAQRRVEAHNFDIRKHLLEYDDVMNKQREVIYQQRRQVLEGGDLRDNIMEMVEELLANILDQYVNEDVHPQEWDIPVFKDALNRQFGLNLTLNEEEIREMNRAELEEDVFGRIQKNYEAKEAEYGTQTMRQFERWIVLQVVDNLWKDHLLSMDHLKEGIGFRSYAQKDPLIEYKKEGFQMFMDVMERVRQEVVQYVCKIQLVKDSAHLEHRERPTGRHYEHRGDDDGESATTAVKTVRREGKKVGRNDPCPCGSGKKYKKCCGK